MKSFLFPRAAQVLPRTLQAAASAVALFAAASAAHAQVTVYSTGFSSSEGYAENSELTSGQSTTGTTTGNSSNTGWVTNDPDNLTAGSSGFVSINSTGPAYEGGYIGGTNYVGTATAVGGYSDGTGAFLGGDFRENFDSTAPADANNNFDVFAGTGTTYLYHPFSLPPVLTSAYTFSVDSTVTSSANPGANSYATAQDSFGYAFRNSAGTTLFSINFSHSGSNPNADIISYTTGGALGSTVNASNPMGNGVTLNGRYHFNITVTATTFDVTFYGQGQTAAQAVDPFNGPVSLTNAIAGTGVTTGSVDQVAAMWTLTNQTNSTVGGASAYYGAGSNSLIFDNYAVTVPEPSTYALMGGGLLGMFAMMKFRRRRA